MSLPRWLPGAASGLVVVLIVTGCGGSGGVVARPTRSTTGATPEEPATSPEGATARRVSYRCRSGRAGTIVVDVPDLAHLADRVNRIQPCEYDEGLAHAAVTVSCGTGPVVVALRAAGGLVAQPSTDGLCR